MARDEITVSSICTCFNKGAWIRQALESIITQETSFQTELIVVDDASTDNSLLEIERFRNEHLNADIKVICHDSNRGIAATWIDACQKAEGRYIARLDGDDFWTDPKKLEQQVHVLETNDNSQWCCTDFDMVDENGEITCKNALQSGVIESMDSYERMFAKKGLTNSSTWLVQADLMREINADLDKGSADDTFGIQLDLFHMTDLSRINRSMCALRVNTGSDSRPMSFDDAKKRYNGLAKQQLSYLEKYTDVDYKAIIRYLIEADTEKHVHLFVANSRTAQQAELIENLNAEIEQMKSASTMRGRAANAIDAFKRILRSRRD